MKLNKSKYDYIFNQLIKQMPHINYRLDERIKQTDYYKNLKEQLRSKIINFDEANLTVNTYGNCIQIRYRDNVRNVIYSSFDVKGKTEIEYLISIDTDLIFEKPKYLEDYMLELAARSDFKSLSTIEDLDKIVNDTLALMNKDYKKIDSKNEKIITDYFNKYLINNVCPF